MSWATDPPIGRMNARVSNAFEPSFGSRVQGRPPSSRASRQGGRPARHTPGHGPGSPTAQSGKKPDRKEPDVAAGKRAGRESERQPGLGATHTEHRHTLAARSAYCRALRCRFRGDTAPCESSEAASSRSIGSVCLRLCGDQPSNASTGTPRSPLHVRGVCCGTWEGRAGATLQGHLGPKAEGGLPDVQRERNNMKRGMHSERERPVHDRPSRRRLRLVGSGAPMEPVSANMSCVDVLDGTKAGWIFAM